MTQAYAIRKKGTDLFLLSRGPRGRGFSFDEPSEPTAERPPRVFGAEIKAVRCLRQWVRGRFDGYRTGTIANSLIDYSYPQFVNDTDRDINDMEVVPVSIEVKVLV